VGPEALVILEETFSKEPLGPAVRDGDSQWAQVVDWVVLATILAEELGIDSTNVGTFADTERRSTSGGSSAWRSRMPKARQRLRPEGSASSRVAADVIAAVGNYAEIYDRNVGPTPRSVSNGASMPCGPTVA
jgi:general L-amino acid transport system substrate-binding protein